MKIIGLIEKSGTFENNKYHNVNLHCTRPDDNAIGEVTEVVKIKMLSHDEVFGKTYKPEDWQALVGKHIVPLFDKYGRVQHIKFLDNKTV